jgi:hypothetical protein
MRMRWGCLIWVGIFLVGGSVAALILLHGGWRF